MDMVVNRLSEIENASVRMIDEANAQKKLLDEELAAELQEYDAMVDAQTTESLNRLKEELHQEMLDALAKLQADTQNVIQTLGNDYDSNHKKLAAKVFKKLVEG